MNLPALMKLSLGVDKKFVRAFPMKYSFSWALINNQITGRMRTPMKPIEAVNVNQ